MQSSVVVRWGPNLAFVLSEAPVMKHGMAVFRDGQRLKDRNSRFLTRDIWSKHSHTRERERERERQSEVSERERERKRERESVGSDTKGKERGRGRGRALYRETERHAFDYQSHFCHLSKGTWKADDPLNLTEFFVWIVMDGTHQFFQNNLIESSLISLRLNSFSNMKDISSLVQRHVTDDMLLS